MLCILIFSAVRHFSADRSLPPYMVSKAKQQLFGESLFLSNLYVKRDLQKYGKSSQNNSCATFSDFPNNTNGKLKTIQT